MSELFKTIPKSLPPKKDEDYEENCQPTIGAVGEEWFIENINAMFRLIKRRKLRKK